MTVRAERRWPYAVSGLLAAVAGIAVGHLVAALVNPPASPVLAVGSAVVDLTPAPLKQWAISTFGTADKPILIVAVSVVTALLAAGIGLLSRRRLTLALVLLVSLVGVAGFAALARPTAGQYDVIVPFAAAVAGILTLVGLRTVLELRGSAAEAVADGMAVDERAPEEDVAVRGGASRRAFLVGAAGVTLAAAAVAVIGQKRAVNTAVPTSIDLPRAAEPLPPLPAGLQQKVPGISPFRTPNDEFYRVDTALILPSVDVQDWTLRIDGAVDRPFTVTWAQLLDMEMIEKDITLNCVSNEVGGPYISSARWRGVRTRDLLERAGVHDGVDQIFSTSTDGMTISTPVQALLDDRDAIVAVAMNGEPLPREHGFPARLITPGLYGFVGATKWLARMTATTYDEHAAYWTERGWATDAPVRTQTRIDTPSGRDDVPTGQVLVGGVAWAQERGIRSVQVRIDDGEWQEATLGPDAGIDYWRQWYLPWDAGSGTHTLIARATDGTGEVQTEERDAPFPSGATGYHAVEVNVG
jgi:DMSO/TMAO reductase YedYZ molybdopterin-dependent catalytic subunit